MKVFKLLLVTRRIFPKTEPVHHGFLRFKKMRVEYNEFDRVKVIKSGSDGSWNYCMSMVAGWRR